MKMLKRHVIILFLFITVLSLQALAQDVPQEVNKKEQIPLRFLLGGAIEFGGDEVAEVYFTNGDTQSVNAGQGISFFVGGQYQFPKVEQLLLRASVGYKYVTTQADNVHIRLTRVPLIFTANWVIAEKVRLGAGIAMHQGINFKADGVGDDISFSNASGPIFEIAYRGIGISYTVMTYKDQADLSYSANAFGITLSGVLPKR